MVQCQVLGRGRNGVDEKERYGDRMVEFICALKRYCFGKQGIACLTVLTSQKVEIIGYGGGQIS